MTAQSATTPSLLINTAGAVGLEVAQAAARCGLRMRVLVPTEAHAVLITAAGLESTVGDLAHPQTLDNAFSEIANILVITEAGLLLPDHERNVTVAARRAGVQHIVHLDAHWPGRALPVPRPRQRSALKLARDGHDVIWTYLCPHFFMQHFLHLMPAITARRAVYAPMQDIPVSMVDLRDVAVVAARLLTQPQPGLAGHVYVVTGPQALTFGEATRQLAIVLGQPVLYVDVPFEAAHQTMLQAHIDPHAAGMLVGLYDALRHGTQAVVTDIVQLVGQVGPHSFMDWARDYAPVLRAAEARRRADLSRPW